MTCLVNCSHITIPWLYFYNTIFLLLIRSTWFKKSRITDANAKQIEDGLKQYFTAAASRKRIYISRTDDYGARPPNTEYAPY